ncbi:MAG TPA: DUF4344 domain-containing metallopeptidase [Longimicrobiaceae bacterium]|nr:DUF4344 domain-containing metallopeptidase [Longimicrobiaceae bacterium]
MPHLPSARRPLRRRALPAMLAALLASGCTPAEGASVADQGDFVVVYDTPRSAEYRQWQADLRGARVLEDVADALNRTFVLPADVRLTFAECGEANAFYDPDERRIRICYELMDDLYGVFGETTGSEEELNEAAWGAIYFTLYHELGHALVHLWDLPITGREEDAVDQLAAFLLTDGTEEGGKAAINGANAFLLEHDRAGGAGDPAPWNEHSLDAQRFYNIVCWVYGRDPEGYAYLVEDGTLPPERAHLCAEEYERLDRSWAGLLSPYLKPQ